MVGGPGERLWPVSTKKRPKPFLPLAGKLPLIQEVAERIMPIFPKERILFVLQEEHKRLAEELFPDLNEGNYIIEPEPKDTAAAIGLASLYLPSDATMVVLSGDHYIPNGDTFRKAVSAGTRFIEENPKMLLLFGIKPIRPETGYGYIEADNLLATINEIKIRRVKRFVEKPDKERAALYLADQNYYWNSGMFIWKKERIQRLLADFMPKLWAGLCQIRDGKEKGEVFKGLNKVSIDYGVLENSDSVAMIEADFSWDDLGTWESLLRVRKTDEKGNLIIGKHKVSKTSECIIYSEDSQIITVGVSDLVIVQVGNNVLVAGKNRSDEIKQMVRMVELNPSGLS
jgi:mannose-1-phosphate guanylyltransferase